ncbi:hypothetical protein [Natronolimnohabitans innermongolicus]|uniref:Uncharacterized protein n=1 Tax=Natronolimnohabitans innermongolicus JCM 12255 TaxID=1227499 RepID=L9X750_9EURY|nr:hypothetical protein [Natronolimnohabitans innermongolicus]ELY56438.1 hypothetical protein C493_10073 [Natronolimnohabitans innermongolicus JCM 12255]
MYRRAFLGTSAVVFLAGCSEVTALLDDTYVDERLENDSIDFSADDGDELTISLDSISVDEDDDVDVQSDSISFRLDHAENGPIETRSVSEPETFDVTIEEDGTYLVIVSSGAADVTVEPVE